MRKLGLFTITLAALLLPACASEGGDEVSGNDEATAEDTPVAHDGPTTADHAGDPIADLSAALLTADDVPGAESMTPFDTTKSDGFVKLLMGSMTTATYEPAACEVGRSDPLAHDDIEVEAVHATFDAEHEGLLSNAAYTGTDPEALTGLADHFDRCPEVTVTGTTEGSEIDVVIEITAVEPPDLGADTTGAYDTVTTVDDFTERSRTINVVDGAGGIILSGDPHAGNHDLSELAATTLERLRAAQ